MAVSNVGHGVGGFGSSFAWTTAGRPQDLVTVLFSPHLNAVGLADCYRDLMNLEIEVLERLRAERMALLRERDELLMRGSEAMRAIQSLRASGKPGPVVCRVSPLHGTASPAGPGDATAFRPPARTVSGIKSPTGEGRRSLFKQSPADLV
jgi:hypothetical protein